MTVFIQICFVIMLIAFVWNRVVSVSQRSAGHNRCAFCRSRLRFLGIGKAGQQGADAGFATTCSRCGRVQPWAT